MSKFYSRLMKTVEQWIPVVWKLVLLKLYYRKPYRGIFLYQFSAQKRASRDFVGSNSFEPTVRQQNHVDRSNDPPSNISNKIQGKNLKMFFSKLYVNFQNESCDSNLPNKFKDLTLSGHTSALLWRSSVYYLSKQNFVKQVRK